MERQPAEKVAYQTRNPKPLSTGVEQLTVEAAVGHVELLEVRKSGPSKLRNSTSELVRVVNPTADIEHLE